MANEQVVSVNENGEIKETQLTFSPNFDFSLLQQAETKPNVAPRYFEFTNPGTKVRGYYLGMTKVEKKEGDEVKEIPVIALLTSEGAIINGGVSLVDTVKKFCRIGEAIEIEYLGTKKVSKGSMKEYAVRPLNI